MKGIKKFVASIAGLVIATLVCSCGQQRENHSSEDASRRLVGWMGRSLEKRLVYVKGIAASSDRDHLRKHGLLYVLGGKQETLKRRIEIASSLYKEGYAGRAYILSRPGITEYSPELGRNLTNDEWSLREFRSRGVRDGDVRFVATGDAYFGTYAEAKEVVDIVLKNNKKILILVSDIHHTKRVFVTFRKILSGNPVDVYVYGSETEADILELLLEYGKYIFYENILLSPG